MRNILALGLAVLSIVAIVFTAMYWSKDSREFRFLKQTAIMNENVEAIAFFSYEGIFDNVELWLADEQYLLFSVLDFEPSLNGQINGQIKQIGEFALKCRTNEGAEYQGIPTAYLADLLEFESSLTLVDVIGSYNNIIRLINGRKGPIDSLNIPPNVADGNLRLCEIEGASIPLIEDTEKRKNLYIN